MFSPNRNYGRLKPRRKQKSKKKLSLLRKLAKDPQKDVIEEDEEDEDPQNDVIEEDEDQQKLADQAGVDDGIDNYSGDDLDEDDDDNNDLHLCNSDTAIDLVSTQMETALSDSGATHYFTTIKGVKHDHFKSILRRAAKFYAYSLLKQPWYQPGDKITSDVVLNIVYDDNNYILEYCFEMLSPRVKPSTIKNTISHILAVSKWLHLFAKLKTVKKDMSSWDMFYGIVSAARNIYAGKEARSKFDDIESIEQKIESGQYPENGMKGLQDLAYKLLDRAHEIVDSSVALQTELTRRAHNEFMGNFFFIIYSFSPQGRACGIENLKEKQLAELRKKKLVLGTNFKTNEYFHYQPISLPSQVDTLFDKYTDNVRLQALERGSKKRGHAISQLPDEDRYIFVNYDGNRYTGIGRLISTIARKVSIC